MAITVTTGTLPLAIIEGLSEQPGRMYIYMEYASSGNVPTYTAVANIPNFNNPLSYYSGLSNSQNFIRVPALRNPIVSSTVTETTGQATCVYLGQSSPSSVKINPNGLNFTTNVICYGAALVYAPSDTDYTRDLILARSYFTDSSERLTKSATSELFISFPLTLNSTKAT